MSNNTIVFSLSQITPPSAPAARELSYGNLAKAIERFEYGMSSNVRVLQSKRTRFNNHSHMTMMTKENSNPKLAKLGRPEAAGYATLSLSLAPADMAGIDLCPMRTAACTAGCLGHNSGHSVMGKDCANDRTKVTPVRAARIKRTQALFGSDIFVSHNALEAITNEIACFVKRCAKRGIRPAVRMNAFSDIVWERVWPQLFQRFPMVKFYDYTKIAARKDSKLPSNYTLTLSRSEKNESTVLEVMKQGFRIKNVAVVFGVKNPADMPTTWNGFTVIDGTADDMRFLDAPNTIVGLSWKGPSSKTAYTKSLNAAIASGFAVSVSSLTR
jgi:hypothetical protein